MSCTRQRGGTILVEALTWWAQPRGGCRPAERKCWGSPGRMVTGSGGVVKGPHSGVWEASRVALWARLGVEPGDGASHVGVLLAEGSSSEAKRLTTCPLSCRRGCGVTVVAGEVMPMGRGVLLLLDRHVGETSASRRCLRSSPFSLRSASASLWEA